MGGILDMGKIEMTDEYLRVGTTLYKIVFQPLINGTFAKRRVPWSMGTLRYDHGKDFIASVPKYDGFCTVPSHVDYKRNIGSFLNLYEPITHTPQKGKFPHIQELILHIFGEHYELGMDYFQLLYLNPVQKLPILLLVSQERNTGKSTFLNFLKAIFQDNVTFNTNEDFRSQFNADWAGKLLIGVDEVLQFFGKFIMCSNNEDTPVLIEPGETRYWVRKINPLKNDDTSFLQKLITEIPAFLYFLQHRQLTTNKESRMWFSPQQIHTPALDRIINCSRNHTEIDLAEICINIMDTMSQDKLTFCINDIQQLLLLSNIKVKTYQIRNILKRNWRLTPTDNSLAYSTFIKNFPPGPPYREEKKTGRYYTITKEFLKKFR